jgi:hypothetical protein
VDRFTPGPNFSPRGDSKNWPPDRHLELGVRVELEGEAAKGEREDAPVGVENARMGRPERLKSNRSVPEAAVQISHLTRDKRFLNKNKNITSSSTTT